jgi:hypothetical protein
MRLDGVVMLAAPTPARAYIQALVAADLLPETLLLLGAESSQASSPPPQRLEDPPAGSRRVDRRDLCPRRCRRPALRGDDGER